MVKEFLIGRKHLGFSLRTIIISIWGLHRKIENHKIFYFSLFPVQITKFSTNSQKNHFLLIFGPFSIFQEKYELSRRIRSINIEPLWFWLQAQYLKKLMSKFREKYITDRQTDGRMDWPNSSGPAAWRGSKNET